MTLDEFKDSLDKYCNGELSSEGFAALEKAMLEDSAKRAYYISYMNLDAALKETTTEEEEEKVEVRKNYIWTRAAVLLVSVGLVMWLAFFMGQKNKTNELNMLSLQMADELSHDGVAIITKVIGFDQIKSDVNKGMTLKPGLLEMSKGLLQLELYSGVSLILEGPLKIDVIDPMNVICHYGQIRSKVPPQAIGFTIKTAEYDVVDLGTEFSLSVDQSSGHSEFLVHQGEIELHNKKAVLMKSLKTGQAAATVAGQLEMAPVSLKTTSFRNIQSLYHEKGNQHLSEWRDYADEMMLRDDVVLFYDFEAKNSWSRTLDNKSKHKHNQLNGAIVGCQWSEGRWQGKGALDYKSISDRVRLNIEGEHDSLTLSTWVKIDSFDRWLSSLFLTDGYDRGEIHWQLSDIGEIILGVSQPGVGNTFSPSVITPEHVGQWLFITTVIDQENLKIAHYLNGKLVHDRKFEETFKTKIQNVELGNWNTNHDGNHSIRSLNGRMDEFILFSSALSSEEIYHLYRQGKPE